MTATIHQLPGTCRRGAYGSLVSSVDAIDDQSGTEYALLCLQQQAYRILHRRRGEITSRMLDYERAIASLVAQYSVAQPANGEGEPWK